MEVLLGVDTLSYHGRLAGGETSLENVFREVAELGATFVQVNAVHLRDRSPHQLDALRKLAETLGLSLTMSGDVIGRASEGDSVEFGMAKLRRWVQLAEALDSPFVRVSSGFYRNELLGFDELIRREQRYVIETLRWAADQIHGDVRFLLENNADFTVEEYVEILDRVGSPRVGVFLDVINPITMLADPLPVVRQLAPWSLAGHVKDYRLISRYADDHFHRRGFDVQYCYPGEGLADPPALLGALTAHGRAEPYHLSIEGLDNHPHLADQRARLGAAVEFLTKLLAGAPVDAGRGRARAG